MKKSRRNFIGGSDIHNVFDSPPYGCKRRLWYEKSGVEPDYPFTESHHMRRGKRLESLIAKEYSEATGRKLRRVKTAIRDEKYPFLIAHIDREIVSEPQRGVLEVKAPGERGFRKIRNEGLPEAYILQLQYCLYMASHAWGSYAIFWADGWQLNPFDVARYNELIRMIIDGCRAFWQGVLDGSEPDGLPPSDVRCQRCDWRTKCQGAALLAIETTTGDIPKDPNMAPLISEYYEAKTAADEAAAHLESIKGLIKQNMGERDVIEAEGAGARIYFRPQTSKRLDTKALKTEQPEIVERYEREIITRPLKILGV